MPKKVQIFTLSLSENLSTPGNQSELSCSLCFILCLLYFTHMISSFVHKEYWGDRCPNIQDVLRGMHIFNCKWRLISYRKGNQPPDDM